MSMHAVGLAVERLGKDARERGLADAACPGEEVRVVQALGIEGVREGRHDVRLADDFLEDPGTPLAGENLIGHRRERNGRGEPDPRHLKKSTMAASFPT